MGKKSAPPPPPDYTAAAKVQADSSAANTAQQTAANRVNQVTPWGTSTWAKGKNPDGTDQWTQSVALSPQEQASLNSQQASQQQRSDLASGMMGRVGEATSQPFDWNNLQSFGAVPQAGNLQAGNLNPNERVQTQNIEAGGDLGRQRIEQGLLEKLRPQNDQNRAAQEAKLANMGLTRGSKAWERESNRLTEEQSRQQFNALEQGGVEQQRQFGMMAQAAGQNFNQNLASNQQDFGQRATAGAQNFGQQQAAGQQNYNQAMQSSNQSNQLRQQQIQEQMLRRQMPLNEFNALMSGQQVGMPQFGSYNTAGRADSLNAMGAAQNQYQAGIDGYNANQAKSQGMMSGLGSLAGMGASMFSDARLKSNIVKVGDHPIGVGIYEYDIFDRRERGVMAQELQVVAPHLVTRHTNGFLMVNYGGLQ